MNRIEISDEEWEPLWEKLQDMPGIHVGQPETCWQFVRAVLWILRSGAQWRVLPSRLGYWNRVFKRYAH
jgi:transposase